MKKSIFFFLFFFFTFSSFIFSSKVFAEELIVPAGPIFQYQDFKIQYKGLTNGKCYTLQLQRDGQFIKPLNPLWSPECDTRNPNKYYNSKHLSGDGELLIPGLFQGRYTFTLYNPDCGTGDYSCNYDKRIIGNKTLDITIEPASCQASFVPDTNISETATINLTIANGIQGKEYEVQLLDSKNGSPNKILSDDIKKVEQQGSILTYFIDLKALAVKPGSYFLFAAEARITSKERCFSGQQSIRQIIIGNPDPVSLCPIFQVISPLTPKKGDPITLYFNILDPNQTDGIIIDNDKSKLFRLSPGQDQVLIGTLDDIPPDHNFEVKIFKDPAEVFPQGASCYTKSISLKTSFKAPPCSLWKRGKVTTQTAPGTADELKNWKCTQVDLGIVKISTEPSIFIKDIFGMLLGISGGIALLLIISSGYQLMMSQGNPEKTKAAQETLTSAIVGLLFIIFAFVIIQLITVDLLKIPGFTK